MTRSRAVHWHPFAAYLYVLHLDGPALAWEYLRRNPDYHRDWRRHRRRTPSHSDGAAQRWGLRMLEDPGRDAREALPDWLTGPVSVQLHPDADPPSDAQHFALWDVPGHKQLRQDGARLWLAVHALGRSDRLALAPTLVDGMAYTRTVALDATRRPMATLVREGPDAAADGLARERPTADALLELHTLQALDGHLAGASAQELARVLFGGRNEAWHADSGLRSRVRRLLRRGQGLRTGDYLRLLQNLPLEQGRFARTPNDPAQNDRRS